MEQGVDLMMNSPMEMEQFTNNQYTQPSPLANNMDMMIMSPINNHQINWIPNVENTVFDYNSQSNQINSSFATFP